MRIAILGAPGSGKTALTRELAAHLDDVRVSDAPDTLQAGSHDHVLLMGLDLPGITPAQQQADAALRAELLATGVSYAVVYGQGRDRLRAALRLLDPQDGPPPRWTGLCEKCADPDCEFRTFLFTRLATTPHPG
jgi:hypothetical protein